MPPSNDYAGSQTGAVKSPAQVASNRGDKANEEPNEDDIIIAIMGTTGAGKSSFIEYAVGGEVGIGHDLESCTTEVRAFSGIHPDTKARVLFVDTPGFDDTTRSDSEILEMIAAWLEETYKKDIKLAGILYLHRITDPRYTGTARTNQKMFEKLCGKNALQKVTLVTTMWDEEDEETARQREEELCSTFWSSMINHKTQVARFERSSQSAWKIVSSTVDQSGKRIALRLQKELVDQHKPLPHTQVAKAMRSSLQGRLVREEIELAELEIEFRARGGDELKRKVDDARDKVAGTRDQIATLHVSAAERVKQGIKATFRIGMPTRPKKKRDTSMGFAFKEVEIRDIREDDSIIAVLGDTGVGKSNFIRAATMEVGGGVGHSMKSETGRIRAVRGTRWNPNVPNDRRNVVFVDTPGFNDTNLSDSRVLQMIGEWLKQSVHQGLKLSAILWLHRITDNRMAGTPLQNLRMFGQLCGQGAMSSVVLITTRWDRGSEADFLGRELQLKAKYWGKMIQMGAQTARFNNTHESAWEVIQPLLDGGIERKFLLIQQEMAMLRKPLSETAAGRVLYGHLITRAEALKGKMEARQRELEAAAKNTQAAKDLGEEVDRAAGLLGQTFEDMQRMRVGLGERIIRFFLGKDALLQMSRPEFEEEAGLV